MPCVALKLQASSQTVAVKETASIHDSLGDTNLIHVGESMQLDRSSFTAASAGYG